MSKLTPENMICGMYSQTKLAHELYKMKITYMQRFDLYWAANIHKKLNKAFYYPSFYLKIIIKKPSQ
jgi:hypothetical protein